MSDSSQTSTTRSKTSEASTTSGFSLEHAERSVTFFARLITIYGTGRAKTLWGSSDEQLKLMRREWASQIGKYSHDQIEEILFLLKERISAGDPDFKFPDVAKILALGSQLGLRGAGVPSKDDAIRILTLNHNRRRSGRAVQLEPAMYQMSRFVDWFSYNQARHEKAEQILGDAYDELAKHVQEGKPFAQPPPFSVEHKKRGPLTDEMRQEGKKKISDLLKGIK